MTERTNEESLELFANLLEPVAEILADQEVADIVRRDGKAIKAVSVAIKNHKKAVVEILALIDGVPVDEYKVNIISMPVKLVQLLNRPEVKDLFTLQGQASGGGSFGSATENTEDGVQ